MTCGIKQFIKAYKYFPLHSAFIPSVSIEQLRWHYDITWQDRYKETFKAVGNKSKLFGNLFPKIKAGIGNVVYIFAWSRLLILTKSSCWNHKTITSPLQNLPQCHIFQPAPRSRFPYSWIWASTSLNRFGISGHFCIIQMMVV